MRETLETHSSPPLESFESFRLIPSADFPDPPVSNSIFSRLHLFSNQLIFDIKNGIKMSQPTFQRRVPKVLKNLWTDPSLNSQGLSYLSIGPFHSLTLIFVSVSVSVSVSVQNSNRKLKNFLNWLSVLLGFKFSNRTQIKNNTNNSNYITHY